MSTPPISKSSPPDTSDLSWITHAQTDIQKEPERLEETAKFLVGIISISLTIFITDRPDGLAEWTGRYFGIATVLWLASALLGFFVLYPWRYRFNPDAPEDIKRAYWKIVRVKRVLLVLSLICFLVAMGVGAYAILEG